MPLLFILISIYFIAYFYGTIHEFVCRGNANLYHYTFLVIVLPKSVSVIIPKTQSALTTLPPPRVVTTPVITSVISLAKIPALQPTRNTNSVLTGMRHLAKRQVLPSLRVFIGNAFLYII